MFKNVDKKIKLLAKVLFGAGTIISCLFAINVALGSDGFLALLIIAAGLISSWILSVMIYGFGEIVGNSVKITRVLNADEEYREKRDALLEMKNKGFITEEEYLEKVKGI